MNQIKQTIVRFSKQKNCCLESSRQKAKPFNKISGSVYLFPSSSNAPPCYLIYDETFDLFCRGKKLRPFAKVLVELGTAGRLSSFHSASESKCKSQFFSSRFDDRFGEGGPKNCFIFAWPWSILVFLNCNSEIYSDDPMIDPAESRESWNYINTIVDKNLEIRTRVWYL